MHMKIPNLEILTLVRNLFDRKGLELKKSPFIHQDKDANILTFVKETNVWWLFKDFGCGQEQPEISFEQLLNKLSDLEPLDVTIPLTSMKVGQIALYKGQLTEKENTLIDCVVMCVFNNHYGAKQYAIIKRGPKQPTRAKKSLKLIDATEEVRVQLIQSCLVDSVDISGYKE